jgi:hypothetical protein
LAPDSCELSQGLAESILHIYSRGYITFKPFGFTDLPKAIKNMTLLPAAWGEKNSVMSSSKKVSPEAPSRCKVKFSAHDAGLDLSLAIAQLPKRSKVQSEILRERKR